MLLSAQHQREMTRFKEHELTTLYFPFRHLNLVTVSVNLTPGQFDHSAHT